MGLLDEFKKYFALKGDTLKKSEIIKLVGESTGVVPEKAPSLNLGAPATAKTYFGGPGNYTLAGVTENYPENLNIFFWDKDEWEGLGIPIVVPPAENKIPEWTATIYTSGSQVLKDGIIYQSSEYTTGEQVPGVSPVWVAKTNAPNPLTVDFHPELINGQHYITNVSPINPVPSTSLSGYSSVSVPVKPGDKWFIKGAGGVGPRLWAFAKSDGTALYIASSSENTGGTYKEIIAPAESAILYINVDRAVPFDLYRKSTVEKNISSLEDRVSIQYQYSSAEALQGRYYPLGGENVGALTGLNGYQTISLSAKQGDIFLIKGSGGSAPRLWAIVDSNGFILEKATVNVNTNNEYISVSVSQDTASKLYVNSLTAVDFSVKKLADNIKAILDIGRTNSEIVFVAASNSSPKDKAFADLICSGVNDELIIQSAIDSLIRGGSVVLMTGDYWIDNFYSRGLDTPPTAIYLGGTTHRFVEIKSMAKPQFSPGRGSAQIRVSEAAYNALDNTTQVAIIGGSPLKAGYFHYNSLVVSDVIIRTPRNEKPTVSLDFRYITTGGTSGVFIFADATHANIYSGSGRAPVPHRQSVGIYGFNGSNSSYYTGFWHTIIQGYGEGFKMGGDHVLMVKCATTRCTYGYTFGTFIGGLHPMTLINCVDETNTNYPFFGQHANMQPITAIDWNMETLANRTPEPFNKHAQEEVPGTFYGEWNWSSMGDIRGEDRFWENDGSGKNFKTWNQHHAQFGTTTVRNAYAASLAQRYYDTDLKLDLIYDGNRWVRADGAAASVMRIGTSSQRPLLENSYAGYQFFDNTINKLIILKSSGVWVDVNGNIV